MNWLMKRALRYGYARLREASTWRNVIILAGGSWAAIHPGQAELLVPVCMGIAGFIGSFFPDLLGAPRENLPPIDLIGKSQAVRPEGDAGLRPSDGAADPEQLRQPVRPVDYPVRHNTDEAADDENNFPGWGS
jgi:hypothetical protein